MHDRKAIAGFGVAAIAAVALLGLAGFFWLMMGTDVGDDCTRFGCNTVSGLVCVHDDAGGFCTRPCDDSSTCESGWTCERTTVTRRGATRTGGRYCMRPEPGYEPLRSGTATVTSFRGSIPGMSVGRSCTYVQTAAPPAEVGYNAHWTVACGEVLLYGGTEGGFNPRSSATWAAGVLVDDANTTAQDGDPAIRVDASTIVIRDDASGLHGELEVTLSLAR